MSNLNPSSFTSENNWIGASRTSILKNSDHLFCSKLNFGSITTDLWDMKQETYQLFILNPGVAKYISDQERNICLSIRPEREDNSHCT